MEAWDDVINSPPNDCDYMQHLTLFEKVCSNFIVFANYVKKYITQQFDKNRDFEINLTK